MYVCLNRENSEKTRRSSTSSSFTIENRWLKIACNQRTSALCNMISENEKKKERKERKNRSRTTSRRIKSGSKIRLCTRVSSVVARWKLDSRNVAIDGVNQSKSLRSSSATLHWTYDGENIDFHGNQRRDVFALEDLSYRSSKMKTHRMHPSRQARILDDDRVHLNV